MIDEKKLIESSTWYPNILFKEELTWKDGWNNCNRDWMKRIDELPKVILPDTTITGWIPCSERLPEENGRYLCCSDNGRMEVYSFANDLHKVDEYDFINRRGKAGFYDYSSEWGYCEVDWVTAWMPLPEPYKESED